LKLIKKKKLLKRQSSAPLAVIALVEDHEPLSVLSTFRQTIKTDLKKEEKKATPCPSCAAQLVWPFYFKRDIYTIGQAAKNGIRRLVHGFVAAGPVPRQ
jgi:hypothetical protein